MPKPKKTVKTEKSPRTAIGERRKKTRPLWCIFLLTLSVLIFAALFDYDPMQSSIVTTDADSENKVGGFGVWISFRLYQIFGCGAILIPIYMLRTSFLCVYKRAEYLRIHSALNFLLLLIAFAGIWNMRQEGIQRDYFRENPHIINSNEDPAHPYYRYSSGHGGLIGLFLYGNTKQDAIKRGASENNLFSISMRDAVGPFGSGLIYAMMLIVGFIFAFISEPRRFFLLLWTKASIARRKWYTRYKETKERRAEECKALFEESAIKDREQADKKPTPTEKGDAKLGKLDIYVDNQKLEDKPVKRLFKKKLKPEPEPEPEPIKVETPKEVKKESKVASAEPEKKSVKVFAREQVEKAKVNIPKRSGSYKFPTLDLLSEPPPEKFLDAQNYQATADALVQTLKEFKVDVNPGEVHSGPVITRYEVTPAAGVRVEKIVNLDKNIALALKAEAVRVLAPVPGKGTVGIEIPNKVPSAVCLKEIIESKAWGEDDHEIPIVLGKEVTGKPIVVDLTKMPHMLIAGSTGSGKTVCINTVIASLLYKMSPDDLRFIMVDPKVVEMQGYNELPHMLIPVVTEPKKVPGALKWLISEMENRFQIFAEVGVRNIAGFNAKLKKDKAAEKKAQIQAAELTPEERSALSNIEVPRDQEIEIPKQKMPFIVCIIDELADLMMVAPADIETGIARIAQLARAAGIHLILATQRPSVNVITGVIKANLPCRIAFRVASNIDSRTIIDSKGAEALIGKGDLLFTPPGTSYLVRAQGAFVSDDEINRIVDFLKCNGPPLYAEEVQKRIDEEGEEGENGGAEGEWEDELVPAAIDVIKNSKRASTSMLQRRLKIGYNRAARIMEMLEDEGMVGPENGSSPREILMDLDF